MTWEERRDRSFSYLDKYREKISDEAYVRIRKTIGSQAIEGFFATEKNVVDMIRIENGEITADELVEQYIRDLRGY